MKNLTVLILLTLSYTFSYSQSFEGEIVFAMKYENLPAEMQGMEGMLPKEFKVFVKNEKSRVEFSSMMGPLITITDNKAKTSTMLMNMMGQKMKMTVDHDEEKNMDDQSAENINIKYLDDTKEIAGYSCKKALLETGNEEDPDMEFYYTEKIAPVKGMQGFEGVGIKGMPLEYKISKQGMTITVTASSIDKKTVDDGLFEIPEEYTEMPESMKQGMKRQN